MHTGIVLHGPKDNVGVEGSVACVRGEVDARYLQPYAESFVYTTGFEGNPLSMVLALEWCICMLDTRASVVLAPAAAANMLALQDCGRRAV
eukprot:gene22181-7197_t